MVFRSTYAYDRGAYKGGGGWVINIKQIFASFCLNCISRLILTSQKKGGGATSHFLTENRKVSIDCLKGQRRVARKFKLVKIGCLIASTVAAIGGS